jgi:hypothetical protein
MSIYYVGMRESDLAINFEATKTDKFFAGSVTIYGRSENGNVAYNVVSGLQLNEAQCYEERNHALFKHFVAQQCHNIVAKDKNAKFLPYSYFFASSIPAEFSDRVICANDPRVLVFLNSKFNFKKFMKGKLPEANFVIESGKDIINKIKNKIYPNSKEVVIQTEFGEGGDGTVFLLKGDDFNTATINPDREYVVSDYIHNRCSIGIQMQISDTDIAIYPPSIQLMKGPAYAGSDVFGFSELPEKVKERCYEIARKFGEIIRDLDVLPTNKRVKLRNRGFFGIDAIIEEGEDPQVYVVETNPRFTGVTGLLNILSHKSGAGSVFEHSYKCYLGERLNTEAIENIVPNGRKRYAEFERNEDGEAHSLENEKINHEGFDKTAFQEEGFYYTHAVFEEIKKCNTFDSRDNDRAYLARWYKKHKPIIRQATIKDIDNIMPIYDRARKYMAQTGNPNQWTEGWPFYEVVEKDCMSGNGYVLEYEGELVGVFVMEKTANEPDYENINGKWLNDKPYGTVRRMASDGTVFGISKMTIDFCSGQMENIRVDTNEDNKIMQHILEKNGFIKCGYIYRIHPDQFGEDRKIKYFVYQKDSQIIDYPLGELAQ